MKSASSIARNIWRSDVEDLKIQRVLGVDPGTLKMGYGVLEVRGDSVHVIDYGVLKASASMTLEQRLGHLFQVFLERLTIWQPTSIAVEEPFVGQNPRTSLSIGRAQTVVLLAAQQMGIPVQRLTPAEVKASLTNYGRGSKEQVQQMVKLVLTISAPLPPDAADALAVALTHLRNKRSNWEEL